MDFFINYLLPFLIVLTFVVFVHELGHFLVARRNGIKVEVFSIGFGPELFGWNDGRGTRWKVSAIPLGGYIRMFGEADALSPEDKEKKVSLSPDVAAQTLESKTVYQRMAVSVAGPLSNFLLAIVLFMIIFMIKGSPFIPAQVGVVVAGSPAAQAGLENGDKIISIDGKDVREFGDLLDKIQTSEGRPLAFKVVRPANAEKEIGEKTFTVDITPDTQKGAHQPKVGIAAPSPEFLPVNPLQAIEAAFVKTFTDSVRILKGIGEFITGSRSSNELGGILAIGDAAGHSAQAGLWGFMFFIAMLSINLGVLNLLPVPVLDGGHILFYIIEAIKGSPVSAKVQEYAFMAGFGAIALLMVYSTWNDITRYKIWEYFSF